MCVCVCVCVCVWGVCGVGGVGVSVVGCVWLWVGGWVVLLIEWELSSVVEYEGGVRVAAA